MVAISTFLTIITATLATKAIAAPSDLDARQLQHQIFSIDIDDDCNHVGSKPPINPAGGAIFVEQNNTCFPQVQPYNVLFIFSSSPENAAGLTCGLLTYTDSGCTLGERGPFITPRNGTQGCGQENGYEVPASRSFKLNCVPK